MVTILADLESVSREAAGLFSERARAAAGAGRPFTVALAGGGTPLRTYQMLAAPPLREEVPWDHVHVFWGDERCVPPDDRRSNVGLARGALLDHVPIPEANVHAPACAGDPAQGARRYDAVLHDHFAGVAPRFDLILLGLGENGHTASLFPDTAALDETERWVTDVYVVEQDLSRVTFTVPLINSAALVVFLVSGASKSETLREVLEGPREPRRLPAQLVDPVGGELLWLVDEAAACRLARDV